MAALRRSRAAAQLLHRPGGSDPVGIIRHLLAVPAQDSRAARLALRARGEGFTAADVDAALTDDRSLVVGWLLRGTLHLVCREDYPWLLGLTAPTRLTSSSRRLGQVGVAPDAADRAVGVIERALADDGPQTRRELEARLGTSGQATPHLLMLAALRGVVVLGPMRADGAQAFALARDWLGAAPPAQLAGADRDRALAELARRYIAAHRPASAEDLATWAGLPLRDARAGLAAAGEDAGSSGLAPRRIAPRLLGPFDPYLLGFKDRTFAVPPEHMRHVHPGGGMLRAIATVDGLAVGTWTQDALELFGEIPRAQAAALYADAEDVARFLGQPRAAFSRRTPSK